MTAGATADGTATVPAAPARPAQQTPADRAARPSGRPPRVWPAPVAMAAVVGAAVVTATVVAPEPRPVPEVLLDGHLLGDATMAVACTVVAALLLTRMPRHPVGLVFAGIAASDGLSVVASAVTAGTGGGLQVAAAWVAGWAWVPGLVLAAAVLPLVVPDGAGTRCRRTLLVGALACGAVLTLAVATTGTVALGPGTQVPSPVAVPGADVLVLVAEALTAAAAVLAVVVLLRRFHRAGPTLRRQVAPLLVAGAVALGTVLAAPSLGRAGTVAQDAALLLVPAAAAVSVLRYRLYDVEVVVHRTVVGLVLSGGVVVAYVVVVQVVAELLGLRGGVASVAATALVAVGFAPARVAVQRIVSRLLGGAAGDPYTALHRTTQLLAGGADPRGALAVAVEDLARGLRSPGVRVVRGDEVLVGSAEGAAGLVADLRSGEDVVGRLEVVARPTGEGYSRTERRLVLDLAAPLAAAVSAVALAGDLAAARDRLARAREEERRAVQTRLHDDVGPAMAALLVQSEVARRRLDRGDLDGARSVLDELRRTAAGAAADVRGVSDHLGPDALDQVGLVDAVRALGRRLSDDDLRVTVEVADDLPAPLPAAVEDAAHRIVAEALTNVRRHARATGAVVRLAPGGDAPGARRAPSLVVEVRDDGIGAGAARRRGGAGVPSMRARAEELGGTVDIASAPGGGTRLRAELPVRRVHTLVRVAPDDREVPWA
ncbi:sensor histidine kinase [Cellulomonas marina]|uniref:Histidine kinase-, DNA gyrase B-, and HSP90-like ATPase n=1 Tax=Cellulomonas marina TaxID=988821 RepID=A0A1I1ALB3_9CELL|nr:ATP-binding protein [Cellulomonas marina]GIG30194.1 hypothetical protein Cma02nite_27940 [Cellulomonas marina]SFB37113.1 Histidine kinase-, DNA gyrase B-, and HSP90-like ATPase [Cellulomonas marina]